jgi:hypothetical protein
MKASPAPKMLNTSIGKPGPFIPASMSSGIARSNTVQPMGPRLTTIRALGASSRILRPASSVSVEPPAMWISSSVPTITSQSGRIVCRWAETLSLATNRSSPSPSPVSPQSTGR